MVLNATVNNISVISWWSVLLVEETGVRRGNRRGRDRMVVGFTTTYAFITNVVSSNPAHREVYLIQHYVIRFESDLRQVGGFLCVLRFPPPIKTIIYIKSEKLKQ
jgi:hypothetical protein